MAKNIDAKGNHQMVFLHGHHCLTHCYHLVPFTIRDGFGEVRLDQDEDARQGWGASEIVYSSGEVESLLFTLTHTHTLKLHTLSRFLEFLN
ncbi:hypothetical protein L6452_04917 [Arctium lappa]|uniref:Uncharacterized protein n=1 Tax=Arctium lappa TaxID=4217 RepID=A0ACB9EEX4_ARCLA|nr:hypothetical protein L6452_04917 [Arctium lappa]